MLPARVDVGVRIPEDELRLLNSVEVGVSTPEDGREPDSVEVGASIGVRICDVEIVARVSASNHCAVTPPDVMMRPVSFAAIAALSFTFVIFDTHLPLSKWCNCADGQLNFLLHFESATHLMLLSGL